MLCASPSGLRTLCAFPDFRQHDPSSWHVHMMHSSCDACREGGAILCQRLPRLCTASTLLGMSLGTGSSQRRLPKKQRCHLPTLSGDLHPWCSPFTVFLHLASRHEIAMTHHKPGSPCANRARCPAHLHQTMARARNSRNPQLQFCGKQGKGRPQFRSETRLGFYRTRCHRREMLSERRL